MIPRRFHISRYQVTTRFAEEVVEGYSIHLNCSHPGSICATITCGPFPLWSQVGLKIVSSITLNLSVPQSLVDPFLCGARWVFEIGIISYYTLALRTPWSLVDLLLCGARCSSWANLIIAMHRMKPLTKLLCLFGGVRYNWYIKLNWIKVD